MPVFIGSIPNTQIDDLKLANEILSRKVDTSNSIQEVTKRLNAISNLKGSKTLLFNRGRDSLSFFLSLLGLEKNDEVITQAFTCVAVVAPILWNNCKPVYVDIDSKSFNMDIDSLEEKITEKTKAVIVQHTFGNLVDVGKVREIVDRINNQRDKEKKIYIIEDCAHIFSNTVQIGEYSDVYFFSFSQDKAISCTQGAMMRILNPEILAIAKEKYKNIPEPSKKDSLYNAKYIKLWSIIKKYYYTKLIPFTNITLGRILIVLFRFLSLIKKQASVNSTDSAQIKKMSAIQACLLLNQLDKVEEINEHRQKIVEIYNQNLKGKFLFNSNNKVLLRYPILLSNRMEIKKKLLEEKIIVGNWYSSPIHPLHEREQLQNVNYIDNSCPLASKIGKHVLNLPTNIEVSDKEATKIVEIVNNFAIPFNI